MRTLNLEQFAREVGGTTDADVQGHIHAGLRSAPTTKTYKRFFERKLRELQAARDATVARYRAGLAAGEFRAPAPPSLEETARGDDEAAAAARRVLAKRAARRNG
jgi:hypothetical protein